LYKLIFLYLIVGFFLTTAAMSQEVDRQQQSQEFDRQQHVIKKRLSHESKMSETAESSLSHEEAIAQELKENLDLICDYVKRDFEDSTLSEKMGGKSMKVEFMLDHLGVLLNFKIVQSSGSKKLDNEVLSLIQKSGPFRSCQSSKNTSFVAEFPTFRVKLLSD
jgi:TonB family protein